MRKEPTGPKEPKTFKHPRLYYSKAGRRLRIIMPNGRVWYCQDKYTEGWFRSCYAFTSVLTRYARHDYKFRRVWNFKTGEEALKAMRRFDRRGPAWAPAQFIGEIK